MLVLCLQRTVHKTLPSVLPQTALDLVYQIALLRHLLLQIVSYSMSL